MVERKGPDKPGKIKIDHRVENTGSIQNPHAWNIVARKGAFSKLIAPLPVSHVILADILDICQPSPAGCVTGKWLRVCQMREIRCV